MAAARLQVHYFLTAVMFFTRIPCPSWVNHDPVYLNRSRKYFALVGIVVGGIAAAVFAVASLAFSASIAAVLSTAATVYATGAFHEDGFADVCDGFGGGWTPERVLEIMKDSRVGAYGVVGLGLLVAVKLVAVAELAQVYSRWQVAAALVFAHAASRFVATTFVYTHDYVRAEQSSKAKPVASERLGAGELAVGGVFAVAPLALVPAHALPWGVALLAAYLAKVYLGRTFTRGIGGYTGDCLGATQQVAEVVIYLTILAAWNWS